MTDKPKYIAYYRVSTQRQGRSGLGIDAQIRAVAQLTRGGRMLAEFTEIESGKKNDRKALKKAMDACKLHGATLVIAKIDRLSRDACFLLGLEKAGIEFIAADMPNANRLTVGIMAIIADEERRMTSRRTKEALAVLRRRGVKLGGNRGRMTHEAQLAGGKAMREQAKEYAQYVLPYIRQIKGEGFTSLRQIAAQLNERDVPTRKRKGNWKPSQVARVMRFERRVSTNG